ncbi:MULTISPECIES: NAD(P)/FAD-dependent oxidoreductase [unclassified Collinsella]|uniref:NAD(P)/FAD-dependent oxidoreductase n=1 Tax=unclassified Collinsella TaxID=2637548 RepID=UPI000E4011DD|nr:MULTISPECIES: NAD(P)/FAD-dependent oxidoreductase [unclassified Collinsella]RGM28925.1 FAD-binding protein [Collinsella sp. OM08-14AT]RGN67894.1 FAD-binding protein [Collinsella sp. OM04-5]RHA66648.1 FAD-binding protein [Collinsella sp. AM43-1]RHJ26643.1 FAD-binding protein [Collinsella sp. AM12-1]
MNTSAFYDVLVIGGGASGLAAAITAARAGKSACIVERDVACGLKLLATGNGRCNLSNESIDPRRYNHPAFVESVMGPRPEQELMGFFSSLGIMTTSEEGRLYPRSLRAESVHDALLNVCDRLGVTLICGANVAMAHKAPEGWTLQIDRPARALKAKKHGDRKSELRSLRRALADTPRKNMTLQAKAVIIATGGSPADIAKTFSLPLTPQRPVLCPVSASVFGDQTALKTLDGLRVRARLTLTRNHEELWHEDGEVLFRTFGISGVAAFNLSRRVQRGDTILLDVFPDLSKDELLDMLNQRVALLGGFSSRDPRWLDGMLAPQFSRVVCAAFEQRHPGSHDVIHLVSILKHFKLLVEGTAEERSAQVIRGGIPIETVSIPGLRANGAAYAPLCVCGEALDIDADCGGFNLAWAWLSGIRAASNL